MKILSVKPNESLEFDMPVEINIGLFVSLTFLSNTSFVINAEGKAAVANMVASVLN